MPHCLLGSCMKNINNRSTPFGHREQKQTLQNHQLQQSSASLNCPAQHHHFHQDKSLQVQEPNEGRFSPEVQVYMARQTGTQNAFRFDNKHSNCRLFTTDWSFSTSNQLLQSFRHESLPSLPVRVLLQNDSCPLNVSSHCPNFVC